MFVLDSEFLLKDWKLFLSDNCSANESAIVQLEKQKKVDLELDKEDKRNIAKKVRISHRYKWREISLSHQNQHPRNQ
jgi:hypothetical protein